MRIEDASASTWLLAGVAGWSLVAWGLALAGMGGRVEPLANDPSLLKPLPTLPASAEARLGPLAQYGQIGARPLFSQDRQPRPFLLEGDEPEVAATAFDYVLTSVLISPGLKVAILQPADGTQSVRVKLDEAPESHPAWRLTALGERSAVFEGPEGQRTMELRVFDGVGGAPPTEVAMTPSPPLNPSVQSVPSRASDNIATSDAARAAEDAARAANAAAQTAQSRAGVPPQPATAPTAQDEPMASESQMEAIRLRIQARRAQLREQNPSSQPPAQSP